MAQLAIIIPLMRAPKIAPLVQNISETTSDYSITVLATGECAEVCEGLPVRLIDDGGGTFTQRINHGFRETTEPWTFTGADDIFFHAGWFDEVMKVAERTGAAVIAINDLMNPAGTHFAVQRSYIHELGGYKDGQGTVFYEAIAHAYCDDALRLTAQNRGKFEYAREAIVEHMHVGCGKNEMDDIYRLGESTMHEGYQIFTSHSDLWQ